MTELNLLRRYPQSKRNLNRRAAQKTEAIRKIARKFDREYFDGDRMYGYGGYNYNPRFWQNVVVDFKSHYRLDNTSSILDVGCGKGFMMHDFKQLLPGLHIEGIDISEYAVDHAMDDVKPFIKVANAKKLPYPDKSFDLVISINTVHNLPLEECKHALREIQRISRKNAFITVDAYHTEKEKKRMDDWNLTALTYMSVPEWEKLFHEVGYTGDYFWFTP